MSLLQYFCAMNSAGPSICFRVGCSRFIAACGNMPWWTYFLEICTLHSLWIKPTDALNSSFIDITALHVSGSLSAHHQDFFAVQRLWYILCSCGRLLPGVGWSSVLLLAAYGSSQLHKMYQSRCTAKNSWWWAERLPETCRVVIPIKLEFSASVGFIHKKSVTMHGHTIIKKVSECVSQLHSFGKIRARFSVEYPNYWRVFAVCVSHSQEMPLPHAK